FKEFGHVSWEWVLSGLGLRNLYKFLRDTGRGEEPPWLAQELRERDPGAVITQAALGKRSDLCVQALHLFVSLYGAEGGNLALKIKATGGLYVGGGIAQKILSTLQDGTCMEAVLSEVQRRPQLDKMRGRFILSDETAM